MPLEFEGRQENGLPTINELLEEAVVKKVRGNTLTPGTIQAVVATGKTLITMLTFYEISPDRDIEQLTGGYIDLLKMAGQKSVADVALKIAYGRKIDKPPK